MSRPLPEGKRSQKGMPRTLYPAAPDVLARLEQALVALGTKAAVGRRTGLTRTAISLYMAGKYPADPASLEAAVIETLAGFMCPWSNELVKDEECEKRFNADPPSFNPAAFAQWKNCQSCLLRKPKESKEKKE